ncbi:MAG TPA: hypothetical protein VJW23_00305, partial [Propionibacteriaceae bacterium]|nr:hypothetical protein [Propionibacteriaceae bacterium]
MVDRLHHDEVPIDHRLVRKLLTEQMPHVAGLQLRAVEPQGTENLTFRLGAELSIRLPRKPSAVLSLMIEREWLPRLTPGLPLAVPVPSLRAIPQRTTRFRG